MILHLDLDCFFAAAHRIDNPHLNNIPIAVGGRSNLSIFDKSKQTRQLSSVKGAFTSSILSTQDNTSFKEYFIDKNGKVRGIITTSSYEARAFGVKTAMSVAEALRWCPELIVIPPNYPLYHKLSHMLKLLLEKEMPNVEQFSIDEFFCDATGLIDDKDIKHYAIELKQKIKDELELPISIGIAKTKWIAKLATNDAKPNGVIFVHPSRVDDYIHNKPIKEFCGIGKSYQDKLHAKGIKTLGQIKSKKELLYSWGKFGRQLYHRVTGTDNEKVSTYKTSSQSLSLGRTFDPEFNRKEIKRRITILCRHLSFIALKNNHNPMTFSLKLKYQYGDKAKDSFSSNRTFTEQHFKEEMTKIFMRIDKHISHAIVQINITLSNFQENKPTTLDLFTLNEDNKQKKITESLQKLRSKFGVDIIKSGGEL